MLKDYKSVWNPLKMLKKCFFGEVAGPQSATLSNNKLLYKYFSFDLPTL